MTKPQRLCSVRVLLTSFIAASLGAASAGAAAGEPEIVEAAPPSLDVSPMLNERLEFFEDLSAVGRPGAASISEQIDPERSALPRKDEETQLRLRLDTVHLERLYEAVRQEETRETVRMSLRECIELALERNRDIQIVQYLPWKADADIMSARGEFDPVLSSNATYIRAQQQTSSEVRTYGGVSTLDLYRTSGSTSLGGKLGWGTTYSVDLNLSKEETTYNRFIEEWSGGLTLTLSQPLLRGRGRAANLAYIRAAKTARLQAEDQLRSQVMTTIAEVVKAYWDLVGAVENVKVRQEALANAERLLDVNEKRYAIQMAAALEVVQAKAGVASRQSDLIAARAQALNAADALKNLINMTELDVLSPVNIVPTDQPSLREVDLSEEESFARAVEHRPEVHSAMAAIERAEIEAARAQNNLLPRLDIQGSVSQGGRGHYPSDVFEGIQERRDNSYSVGFQGSVPIGNRAARGAYHRAVLDKREAEERLEKVKQDLLLNVRVALRNAATSRILVESNKQARVLQETNVTAEEQRLRLGMTSSFEVLRVQSDLTAAQVQELQSIIAYEKALVDLRLAEGMILEDLGIEFEPEEGDKPVSFFRSVIPQLLQ